MDAIIFAVAPAKSLAGSNVCRATSRRFHNRQDRARRGVTTACPPRCRRAGLLRSPPRLVRPQEPPPTSPSPEPAVRSKPIVRVRLQGLEPWTYGLKVRPDLAATNDSVTTSGKRQIVLADCLADERDLPLVVERWKNLPGPIRAAIITLVNAAGGPDSGDYPGGSFP